MSTDEKLSLILSKVSLNENRVIQIQNKLDTVLDLKRRVSSVECVVTSHANRLKLLEYRSLDIEARGRRHNLLFKGIAEDRRENCFDKVRRFIREELNIERDLYLERAHRLGKYIHGKTRPIKVAFRDFYDVEEILGSAPNLRGTAYGVSRDYPNEISKARNSLWKQFKDIRDNNKNKKVSLGFPAKIMVDNAVVVDLCPDWFEILRGSRVDLDPEKNESRNRNEYHPVQNTNTISMQKPMTRPASNKNNENIDLTPVTVDRNTTDLSQTQFPLTQNSACDQPSSMNESETVSLNNNIEIVPSQNEIGIARPKSISSDDSNIMDFLEGISPSVAKSTDETSRGSIGVEASGSTDKGVRSASSSRGRSRTRKQNNNMGLKHKNGSTASETKSRATTAKAPKIRNSVSLESKSRVQASLEILTQVKSGKLSASKEPKTTKKSTQSQQQDTGARPKTHMNQNGQSEGAQ